MPSLRKRASNFFRLKSVSSTDGSVASNNDSLESLGKFKRSKSLPIDAATRTPDSAVDDETKQLGASSRALSEPKMSDKSVYQAESAQAFSAESTFALPVVPMPMPELVPSPPQALSEFSVLADKAEQVIHADEVRSTEQSALTDGLKIFESYDSTLDLKSSAQSIISNVKSCIDEDPWFMRALDDVARIHPFVSVAVIAFKACYNMEMARRQNDRRVIALFREMKDMIEVLTRLKDITDPEVLGPNGSIIRGKMQSLVDTATQDMKDCENACDAWMKKKVLVKVFVGIAWEGQLAAFTSTFARRRMEFDFALQIHTATAVDAIQSVAQAMNEKLAYMSQQFAIAFDQMRPPEEVRLLEVVKSKGGVQAVQSNEIVLRDLFKAESPTSHGKGTAPAIAEDTSGKPTQTSDGAKMQRVSNRAAQRSEYTFSDFKEELHEDWDTALKSNFEAFEGKFKLFYDQLEMNLHKYMREESDRVISEVNKGPHDLIRDPELRLIWQEMHWRRNVKARPFVMTLRDHFIDKMQDPVMPKKSDASTIAEMSNDSWAHQYVDVKYLQSIMDAIDDDGSGHVTITEVNRFTEHLPSSLGWSLTIWLAYWAIGWQTFATKYREEILQTFARMFAMRDKILPENRNWADYYLRTTWYTASVLAKSLQPPAVMISDQARERFEEYVQYEEDRMRKSLVAIKYDIDAMETVYGVLGPGRIEKHVLTLICLILRRDLELFHLATKVQLHEDELWDAADSLVWVYDAVQTRYRDLIVQFEQQRLDVSKQMKAISCELFDYYHDSSTADKMSTKLNATEQEPTEEVLPAAQLGDLPPNNYPPPTKYPYDCDTYNLPQNELTQDDREAPDIIQPFLGAWNGYIHKHDGMVERSMVSFFFHAAVDKEHHLEASSFSGDLQYTVTASVTQEDGVSKIKVVFRYVKDLADRYYTGFLREDGTITGSQGDAEDESAHDNLFIWARVADELMRLRPLPPYLVPSKDDENNESMVANKPRAMFDYAIRAVIFQNRKKSWSWTYFKERRDNRVRFLHFLTECELDYNAYSTEPKVMDEILRSVTNLDRRFYDTAWTYFWSLLPHHTATCDVCQTTCQGVRYTCLECIDNATSEACHWNSVDFCKQECSEVTVHPRPEAVKTPHTASHDVLKMRTFMGIRDLPRMYTQGKHAMDLLHQTLDQASRAAVNGAVSEDEKPVPPVVAADGSKVAPPQATENPCCGVCQKAVILPCWLCVQCLHHEDSKLVYICDACEDQTLLKCLTCERPFKQTRWYYGSDPRDTFQCATCVSKRVPAVPAGTNPHTYVHNLVRCNIKEGQAKELTAEERNAAVVQKVDALDQRLAGLEGYLERIETMLAAVSGQQGNEGVAATQ